MKKKPIITNTKYTTMGARQAAEKGLNDILEKTPLKPLTLKEFEKHSNKNENDILERIEFVKIYLSECLRAYPPISPADAQKEIFFKDGKYNLLLNDNTIDDLTKEAIKIYTRMDYLKREFIKSEYKPSFDLLSNFMVIFQQFGFLEARKCLQDVRDHGWNDLHWGLNRKKEQKKIGTERDKKIIQHLKRFYIQNEYATDKEAYSSISESLQYSLDSAKKYFYRCKKMLNKNQK